MSSRVSDPTLRNHCHGLSISYAVASHWRWILSYLWPLTLTFYSRLWMYMPLFFFLKSSLCFQWEIFLDSEGRVIDSKALKKRIFYGGVEHSTCKEVCSLLETFWLNMLIFLGLTIMNISLATSVGISCLWFNIRWEGIPQVNQKVRVWDSKTTMAGLLQFSLFHILKLKSSPVVFYALIFLFISTSTDLWNMLFCCRHFTCLGL